MDNTITGPEVKEFNPAALVYKNDAGEKVLNLDAKMAWFHWLKPGWRITIDGLRVFGMEVYVNNTYEVPDKPGEYISRREKEIVYQAVGFISMLDAKSVRVASVPMNIDASDPDFCGKLFEDGAEFLLDFCGFNVYNITKAQWEAAMEERINSNRTTKIPTAGGNDKGGASEQQSKNNADDMKDQFFDNMIPNQAPMGIDAPTEPEPFNFQESFNNMPLTNTIGSEPEPEPEQEDELSMNSMLKLFNEYNNTLAKPAGKDALQDAFGKYCIFYKGQIYAEMDASDQYDVLKNLKQMIADAKNKRK